MLARGAAASRPRRRGGKARARVLGLGAAPRPAGSSPGCEPGSARAAATRGCPSSGGGAASSFCGARYHRGARGATRTWRGGVRGTRACAQPFGAAVSEGRARSEARNRAARRRMDRVRQWGMIHTLRKRMLRDLCRCAQAKTRFDGAPPFAEASAASYAPAVAVERRRQSM